MKMLSLFGGAVTRNVSGLYDNGGTTTQPADWLVNYIGPSGQGGLSTVAGVNIDEWIAEGMPAVYACVHAISETVGQLPLKLYKKTEKGREVAEDHPLYVLLHDLPNPEMTAYQFRELLTRHLAMWGRAYAFIQRDKAGEVQALWPIHPLRVKVDRDGLGRKRYTISMPDGVPQQFLFNPDAPPILHLHMNSNDGLDGRSPIMINRQSLGVSKAAEDFVGAYFGNGAIPGIILTHPGKMSEKAKDNLKRSWFEKFGGAKNRNKLAVFEEGLKLDIVGVDPQKSQLSELRESQISASARIWRVPNVIIQNNTKDTSWGSGVEQLMIGWVNTGLMPYFEQWQQAITRDCLSRKTYRTHYAKFVTAAITRGDLKSTMDAIAVGRQNTILSGDEGREMLEMNKIPDGLGELYLTPSGAQVLLGDGAPIGPEPPPVPPDPKPVAAEAKGVM
jgi:HK97 family phage portal protein